MWLRVREDRAVSDAVEERLGVKHESPQIILFYEETPLWHTSHGQITRENIQEAVHKCFEGDHARNN